MFGIERPLRSRVGGLGERRRGARARLPRHVPRGRVLASGRQHPADPRRRPARRRGRRRAAARHRHSATRCRSTSPGPSPCTRTRSTTSPTSGRAPPPASARCSGCGRHRLPGHRPGAAHDDGHAAVAQGRDLHLEGLRARVRRQGRDRGGRPGDARPDQPGPDLGGRGRRHRPAARRTGWRSTRCRCRRRASRGGRSCRASRRSTPRSTRRRRGSTSPAASAREHPELLDPAPCAPSCCTPRTTPTS